MYRTTAGKAVESQEAEKHRPIQLAVRPRGKPIKNLPKETYALPTDSCADIYDRISAKARFSIDRLRITKESDGSHIQNSRTITVDEAELYEGTSIQVKDLGPQIAWKTVFVIEYLGPLIIHPAILLLRPYIFHNHGEPVPHPAIAQTLSMWLIVMHFCKREFETLFIHRFSSSTMPAMNIFKNSAHYWILAGLNIAFCTYTPSLSSPTTRSQPYPWWNAVAVILFFIGELGNLWAHIILMNLRSAGGTERGIPTGGVFSIIPVTCPNYFFEIVAWIGIWMANRSWSTAIFIAVAGFQMAIWAQKKERRYRREFGDRYKKRRSVMIPFIF